jgi:5-methylcytosine-specific restriction enzyme subunit McrC
MSKDSATNPVTIREYERLTYARLSEAEIRQLEQATERFGIPLFRFFRTEAQAQQYVGVVKVGERTIQILPKIYADDRDLGYLVFLLSYTQELPLYETGIADYQRLSGSFLEIWIRHFAKELNRLLRARLTHRYVEVEESTSFLRGKLLVERDLAGTGRLYGRYACRYEVFTPDHLLNQVLRFCNVLLLRQTRVPSNRKVLQENDALLSDVTYQHVRPVHLEHIHLDRLNRDYEPVLELCRLLLDNSTLNLEAGSITQLAFVFDMNRLFEKFVARFLQRHKGSIELGDDRRLVSVDYQQTLGRLFEEFKMDVDLVLTDNTNRTLLVDTKYKALEIEARHMGLSQTDFYQMYAYGRAGKEHHNELVLLYPATGVDRRTFRQDDMRLHIRQFDPQAIYNPHSRSLNEAAAIRELSQALS